MKIRAKILAGVLALVATAAAAAGLLTNGLPDVAANTPYSQVTSASRIPVDTNLTAGLNPASVGASPFQVAAIYAEAAANTATSTVHAATLNTRAGVIVTEALTTAAGATYTFTLTNSLITATSTPMVSMYSVTNTAGTITLTSITPAAGSVVFVWTNTGTAAFNGTMNVVFHI